MLEIKLKINELDQLISKIPKNGIVLLKGNLASGKTFLVKEICKFYKMKDIASSPTFSVMNVYKKNDFKIFHYDIYQNGVDAFISNGLFENLFEEGLHLIEWGDSKLESLLNTYELDYIVVEIDFARNSRLYRIYGV